MTVAAVILAARPESALADADGTPAVRRLADVAWSGGATPVVVCSFDPDEAVSRALANAEATLTEPVAVEQGPVGQITNAIDVARGLVIETAAALVFPARLAWVDAETVTTLIAAHGADRDLIIRPTWHGEAGWPVLVPVRHVDSLRRLATDRLPDDLLQDLEAAGAPFRRIETGDPGVTHDLSTPRSDLPPYDGPPEPADPHAHEWGAAAADEPDEAPPTTSGQMERRSARPSGPSPR
jgi:CTP:molybdopterin cytidylyltransferase MocA